MPLPFRTKVIASALALAVAGTLVLAPVACDGGGAGLAFVTVGLSLAFIAASPGWALRDPTKTGGPTTTEQTIHIGTAGGDEATVERLIFLGGELRSPVVVAGTATARLGGPATLAISLELRRMDGGTPTVLATASIPVTTATPFRQELRFTPSPATTSNAGDVAVLAFTTPSGEDIDFDAASAVVDVRVRKTKRVRLFMFQQGLAGGPHVLDEDLDATQGTSFTLGVGQTVRPHWTFRGFADGYFDPAGTVAQTSNPTEMTYRFKGEAKFSIRAATSGAPASFTLALREVDGNGNTIQTFGTAGPFTAGTSPKRFQGTFQRTQTVTWYETSDVRPSERFFELFIENLGPDELTIIYDPTGADTSFIDLPPPLIEASLGGPKFQASQPAPR